MLASLVSSLDDCWFLFGKDVQRCHQSCSLQSITHRERAKAFDWIFVVKFGLIDLLFCFCTEDRRKKEREKEEKRICVGFFQWSIDANASTAFVKRYTLLWQRVDVWRASLCSTRE